MLVIVSASTISVFTFMRNTEMLRFGRQIGLFSKLSGIVADEIHNSLFGSVMGPYISGRRAAIRS